MTKRRGTRRRDGILDREGEPLKGVAVVAGGRTGTTNKDGKVVIGGVPARRPAAVSA